MREWLRAMRNDQKLTMKDMGSKLGISESYYCAIENGDRQKKMDISLVSSLSVIFQIPISTIVAYEQDGA